MSDVCPWFGEHQVAPGMGLQPPYPVDEEAGIQEGEGFGLRS